MKGPYPSLLVSVGLAGLIAATSCDSGGAPPYTSPQSVFDAVKKAADNEDWEALSNCMTPESVEWLAVELVSWAVVTTDPPVLDPDRIVKIGQINIVVGEDKIMAVLAKHDVDESTRSEAKRIVSQTNETMARPGPEVRNVLLEPIKDRRAFVADMMPAMRDRIKFRPWKYTLTRVAKLEDLDIDGDSATGTSAMVGRKAPIVFEKIGEEWSIDFKKLMAE